MAFGEYIREQDEKLNKIYEELRQFFYDIGVQLGREIAERYKNDPDFRACVDALNRAGEEKSCGLEKN